MLNNNNLKKSIIIQIIKTIKLIKYILKKRNLSLNLLIEAKKGMNILFLNNIKWLRVTLNTKGVVNFIAFIIFLFLILIE